MKEPIEYLGNVNSFTTREELYRIGKQMQIDSYNQALVDSVTNVRMKIDNYPESYTAIPSSEQGDYIYIDYESILKLKK